MLGEVLSSDDSIENADSIGTAISLRQDDNKTVKVILLLNEMEYYRYSFSLSDILLYHDDT